MEKVTIILVGGDAPVDKFITKFTGGRFSHVAALVLGSTFESTGIKEPIDPYPGVWLHDPNKYVGNPNVVFVDVEVPDLAAGEAEVRKLLGTPYSYIACVKGGLHDILGIDLPDTDFSMDCSETITRFLRACGLDFLSGHSPGSITPDDIGRELAVE